MQNTALINNFLLDPSRAWLDLTETDLLNIVNPLLDRTQKQIERPDLDLLRILRNPKYFWFTCKHILNLNLHPFQVAILQELWVRPFPLFLASRGGGKSFILAVYAILKCMLVPGTKVIVVGAAFRQAKVIFEYMETIWRDSSVLRNICNSYDGKQGPSRDVDRCTMRILNSWCQSIPLGDGAKIRGLRAHTIIADEFQSISPAIYETVVAGFASVSAHPIDNVIETAKRKRMKKQGAWNNALEDTFLNRQSNQSIITGTADYDFKHFASYWRRYKGIVESHGDLEKIADLFDGEVPTHFNWRDYSVIRIPYELLPEGFMDEKTVARSKATVDSGIYSMEFSCVFIKDSQGFFKRSLIESCVASDVKPIGQDKIWFDATIRGFPDRQYVYGVDPAFARDNFTIVILELWPDHVRVVHAWSTNEKNFKERQKLQMTDSQNYYGFCARKIRDLMKVFPPAKIAIDTQGGGVALMEALHDSTGLLPGELPLWPTIIDGKPKDTDERQGLHILELINFANADWTAKANHDLLKDMQNKTFLFPRFDQITLGLANEEDAKLYKAGNIKVNDDKRVYDSLEDCVLEIEDLKNELSTIVVTTTPITGRERWDVPQIKGVANSHRKGTLRKDRYSATLCANAIAREIQRTEAAPEYQVIGRASHLPVAHIKTNNLYNSNTWVVDSDVCIAVPRNS